MISVVLKDAKNGSRAKLTNQRQLITAPLSYSSPIATTFDTTNTAFNIVSARAGFRIVITDLLLYGDKNVDAAADATVDLYEATDSNSTTISKSIVSVEIPRRDKINLTGLNWVTSEGVFINGKTNDTNIFSVVGAYYIPSNIENSLLIT